MAWGTTNGSHFLALNPAPGANGKALEKGGLWFNPVAYGAKFDGVTSDTAAWTATIADLTPSRGSQLTIVAALGELVMPGGTSVVPADTIAFRNMQGVKVRGVGGNSTTINITGAGTNGIDLNGIATSTFSDFAVNCAATCAITNIINWHWGDMSSGRSCTDCQFRDLTLGYSNAGTFMVAFAVGNDLPGQAPQVDSGLWEGCRVTGNYSGDNAHYAQAWLLGNGTQGNNYNHLLINCDNWNTQNFVKSNASDFWQIGGQPGGSLVDYVFAGTATIGILIQGVQSQSSTRLLTFTGGGSTSKIRLSDVTWDCSQMNADGQFIQATAACALSLDNVSVHGAAVPVVIQCTPQSAARHQTISTKGCAFPTAVGSLCVIVGGFGTTSVTHIGYMQNALADDTSLLETAFWTNRAITVGLATPVYSAAITPDASQGVWQTITVTNATAFTINAPTHPPDASRTAELTVEIFNNSGGAMGVITWNGALVFQGLVWANPASTKRRFVRFEWNGANWIATAMSTADY
jgi:hypothetical protein